MNWFSSSITFPSHISEKLAVHRSGKTTVERGRRERKQKERERKFLRKSAFDEAFDTLDSELKRKGKPKRGTPSFNASYSAVTPYAGPELTA